MLVSSRPLETASPITAGATARTVALYRYLLRLSQRPQWFFGFEDRLRGMPSENASPILWGNRDVFFNVTGKYPAAMQYEYHDPDWANRYGQTGADLTATAITDAYRAGCIISLHNHPGNPVTGAMSRNGQSAFANQANNSTATGYWQDRSGSPLAAIKTGGAQEAQFLAFLDRFANFVTSLVDDNGQLIPVIWRPFHECSNTAHWWAGPDRQADFILVWQKMVDYLRTTKGVTNLLYSLNFDAAAPDSASPFSGWWPGPTYVDIVSFDAYDNRDPAGNYVSLEGDGLMSNTYNACRSLSLTHGKPVMLAEFGYQLAVAAGTSGIYTTRTGDLIEQKYQRLCGGMSWGRGFGASWGITASSPTSSKNNLTAMVQDPQCITADRLSGVYA